jgi:hypothetical protein
MCFRRMNPALNRATKLPKFLGNFPSLSTSEGTSPGAETALPPTNTRWHPTPRLGTARARSTASSNASPLAIRVALVRMPSRCARTIPSFTPRVNPKSSAFRISSTIWMDGLSNDHAGSYHVRLGAETSARSPHSWLVVTNCAETRPFIFAWRATESRRNSPEQFSSHTAHVPRRICECSVKVFNSFVENFVEKSRAKTQIVRECNGLLLFAQILCNLNRSRSPLEVTLLVFSHSSGSLRDGNSQAGKRTYGS